MIYRYERCPEPVTMGHLCLLLAGLGDSTPIEVGVPIGPSQKVSSG
ncbi:hypothetical protein [Streptomyces goshikiensis]